MSHLHSFAALGTTWWIELFEELDEKHLAVIYDDCEVFVATFENNYSRFKPTSLITRLNTEREIKDPNQEFIDLLNFGKSKYLETDTKFNILTGHIQEAQGYDAEYSFVATKDTPLPGNPVTDVIIDTEKIELIGESKVDLGGFGKGYLIDLLAEQLKAEHQLKYFLINAGGDMYATSDNDKPIEIHLEHPTKANISIGITTLHNEAFAASSPHKRKWVSAHSDHNHIIGKAKESSFVKAATAREADVLATVSLME